jgi:hypothetical protein
MTFYSQYCIGLSDDSTQNHRNMVGTTNLQKKMKIGPKKAYMFSILKLKRPKNSHGGYRIFSPGTTKISSFPNLLENIPEYTKENKI